MHRVMGAVFVVVAIVACSSSQAREHRSGDAGKYCLSEWFAGENVNCTFRTLAQCEQSKTSFADSCQRNPHTRSTTGSATRE
jgi:hypothetical protein